MKDHSRLLARVMTVGALLGLTSGMAATAAGAASYPKPGPPAAGSGVITSGASYGTVSPPFSGASDYINGFACGSIGPAGLVSDGVNFYVADGFCTGNLYKMPLAGGSVTSGTFAADHVFGLGYNAGVHYAATEGGPLYTFDPNTLALTPTQVTLPCSGVMDIAADPLSDGLVVSSFCGIFLVQHPTSSTPTVSTIVEDNNFYDGLAISSDGQHIWASRYFLSTIVEYSRTGTSEATIPVGGTVSGPDGIAVASNGAIGAGGLNVSNNVFVNDNDGTILRIDTNNSNALSVVASGGTRGDFATVAPDGCLYATQSDRIEKLSPCLFGSSRALAYAARVSVAGFDTGDVAAASATGAQTSATSLKTVNLGLATLSVGNDSATGAINPPAGKASSHLIDVSLLGGAVRASAIDADAAASFSDGASSASALGSGFAGLVVEGKPIPAAVPPNTALALPGLGTLVLNEQVVKKGGSFAAIQVNMIHFVGLNKTEIVIGSAFAAAGAGFPQPPPAPKENLPGGLTLEMLLRLVPGTI